VAHERLGVRPQQRAAAALRGEPARGGRGRGGGGRGRLGRLLGRAARRGVARERGRARGRARGGRALGGVVVVEQPLDEPRDAVSYKPPAS